MRSGCVPSVCEAATRPILPWLALAIGLAAIGHLAWEAGQLPLYTLWSTGTLRAIGFRLIHCTGGDVLITTATFSAAAMLARPWRWPAFGWRMALAAILLGAGYTILSEWLRASPRCCNGWWFQAWLLPSLPTDTGT